MIRPRTKFSRAFVAAAAFLAVGYSGAEDRVGATILTLPLSVRQMGMGDVSTGGSDILRAYSNPALLADQVTTGEVAVRGASMFGGEQTTGGLGAGWRINDKFAVGLLFTTHSLSTPEIDRFGDPVGGDMAEDTRSIGIAGASRFGPIRVGIGLKSVSESIADESGSAIAIDAGLAAAIPAGPGSISTGVSLRNAGSPLYKPDDPANGVTETLPTEVRAGFAYRLSAPNVGVGLEYSAPKSLDPAIGAGIEWWPAKFFGVRAGATGLGGEDDIQITAGLSGVYKGISIDYALGTHPLGATNRVALSYAFGGAPTPGQPRAARVKEEKAEELEEPVEEAAPAGKILNFAVADLEAQNVSAGDAAVIADLLRNEIVKSKRFNVVEKKNMDRILAEQAFQQSGCTSEECAVKLGKLLNVHRMAMGSFGKLLENYYINIRVINVESGKIIFSESYRGKTGSDVEQGVRLIGNKIRREVQ